MVYSPCISVCDIDEQNGFCKGCMRTLDEIAHWVAMGAEKRHHVLSELEERKKAGA